jgi:hypothetical protein
MPHQTLKNGKNLFQKIFYAETNRAFEKNPKKYRAFKKKKIIFCEKKHKHMKALLIKNQNQKIIKKKKCPNGRAATSTKIGWPYNQSKCFGFLYINILNNNLALILAKIKHMFCQNIPTTK